MDQSDYPFQCKLSFRPLIDYLRRNRGGDPFDDLRIEFIGRLLERRPELNSPISTVSALNDLKEDIGHLMNIVYPPVIQETEPVCAAMLGAMQPFFSSPPFKRLFLNADGAFKGDHGVNDQNMRKARLIRAYLFILETMFPIPCECDYPLIYTAPDPDTGLERSYKMQMDFRFVEARPLQALPVFSEEELAEIQNHFTHPEILEKYIRPEHFELHGFHTIHAVDITESQVLLALEQDLIKQESITSLSGFLRIQDRLRTYFQIPDVLAALAAIQGDRILLLNSGSSMEHHCIFADTLHVHTSAYEGSPHTEAVKGRKIVWIRDLQAAEYRPLVDKGLYNADIRSFMITPLEYQGEIIGTLDIATPRPGELGPMKALLATHLQPLFAIAIQRAFEELDNNVQAIIKEKFTAIHPVVEWRFHKSVLDGIENQRLGRASDPEPIVFRNVYPVYGASDIRGSTNQRNEATQKDLSDHLNLALNVVQTARSANPLPIFGELGHRICLHMDRIAGAIETGDEVSVIKFLLNEVESIFGHLKGYGPAVVQAIETYENAIDPNVKTIYRLRKHFENSVYRLNERLSLYLDRENAEAQKLFPHYYERHRTDGVDYLIYIGDSLMEKGGYNPIYLKNLRLWQLQVTCGLAWHTESLKPELDIPLDTAHLILVQNTPLSLRFRYDEKQFGVDGAYDIQHEIIKSRIDKATVRGSHERLTQPGKIAVVYTHTEEANEIEKHIAYLREETYLTDEFEMVELDHLPGVHGLKAIRAGIDLASKKLAERAARMIR